MSDTKNVTRQVQSVSPYNPSFNSSLLQNSVDTSINGTPSTSQTYKPVSLNTTDFTSINQSQKQDGYFVSSIEKTPVYSISPEILAQNEIKQLEEDIGVPYTFLSYSEAQKKASKVKNDFLRKNNSFPLNEFSTSSKIGSIEEDMENLRLKRKINTTWDSISHIKTYNSNRGTTTDIGKDYTQSMMYSVVISESREGTWSYSEIGKGQFLAAETKQGQEVGLGETVVIRVLSNVQNFSFGTIQSFTDVEPRGSQTPMRFYKNNPGRTLGFTAEFYQQEYPKEPLLSIAEKAQYLCRPYRHGDYSVIPKLVKVEIPGRTFRGYLTQASVTYSYDMGDYRTWDRNKVEKALSPMVNWSTGDYNQVMIDTNPTGLVGGNYNTAETMDYGLGKMTIDFQLVIVEEIKLTLYKTLAEVNKEKEDQEQYWEATRNQRLIEGAINNIKNYQNDPDPKYDEIRNTQEYDLLILVDDTGTPRGFAFNEETGEILTPDQYPEGTMTLRDYNQKKEMNEKLSNHQNQLSKMYDSDDKVYNAMQANTKGELIIAIKDMDYTDEYTLDRLENMSVKELMSVRDEKISSASEDTAKAVDIANDFSYITSTKDPSGNETYSEYNSLQKSFPHLYSFLTSKKKGEIKDLVDFCKEFKLDKDTTRQNYDTSNFFGSYIAFRGYDISTGEDVKEVMYYYYKSVVFYNNINIKYGIKGATKEDPKPMLYMEFSSVSSDLLAEKYKVILSERFNTPGRMLFSEITRSDFITKITYKDDKGYEDPTIKEFFKTFYSELASQVKEFYLDSVKLATYFYLVKLHTQNYCGDREAGKVKFPNESFTYFCSDGTTPGLYL